jgi:hypothetical protein
VCGFSWTHEGGYNFSDVNVLLQGDQPFISQNYCNATIEGYTYHCSFSADGYKFEAISTQGGNPLTIVTGGIES